MPHPNDQKLDRLERHLHNMNRAFADDLLRALRSLRVSHEVMQTIVNEGSPISQSDSLSGVSCQSDRAFQAA